MKLAFPVCIASHHTNAIEIHSDVGGRKSREMDWRLSARARVRRQFQFDA